MGEPDIAMLLPSRTAGQIVEAVGRRAHASAEQQQRPNAAVSSPKPTTATVQRSRGDDSNGPKLLFIQGPQQQQRSNAVVQTLHAAGILTAGLLAVDFG